MLIQFAITSVIAQVCVSWPQKISLLHWARNKYLQARLKIQEEILASGLLPTQVSVVEILPKLVEIHQRAQKDMALLCFS